ncbi:hypothetical protein L2W58_11005 [Dethiosulfovibrio sp. F2B]|uniref:hypothetical protein n=1 Tax=Dethiosulfovibrio faecalis TaxID=2720018 RepID=UPI001F25D285|nr:hypothetical protein [Dethiosulfovibrio faecalis]MCF4152326.1 hypothetical protein [Dethiosulfovibrio faecalis]
MTTTTMRSNATFYVAEEFKGPFVGYTLCDPIPQERRFAAKFEVNSVRYRGPFEGIR